MLLLDSLLHLKPRAAAAQAGCILAAILLFSPFTQAQELTQQPGIMGYIHLDNPLQLVEEADAIGAQLGQSVSGMLPLLGGNLFKTPGLQGIDMEQPMTFLFGLNPETGEFDLSFVLNTTSPDAYFQNFGKVFGTQMTEQGTTSSDAVRQFTEITTSFDHEGHMAAMARGENPSQADYQIETTKTWFTALNGQQVLVSPSKAIASAFSENSTVLPKERIVPGSVLIGGQMESLKGMLLAPLQLAIASGQLEAANDKTGPSPEMNMLDLVIKGIEQIEDIQIGAALQNANFDLFFGAKATADSDLGKWFSSVRSINPNIIKTLPANTSIVYAGYMPPIAGITKFFADMIVPGLEPEIGAEITKYVELLSDWDRINTGQVVGGMVMENGKAAGMVSTIGVTDAVKAREFVKAIYDAKTQGSLMQVMMSLVGTDMPEGLAPAYTSDVATLDGAPVDGFKMDMTEILKAEFAKDPSLSEEEAEGAMAAMSSMSNIFSDAHIAFLEDRILFASGTDKAGTLEQLAHPSGPGPDIAQTLDFSPDAPAFLYHLPLDAYMGLFMDMMPAEELPMEQIGQVQKILENVVISMYGACRDRTATFGLRYPINPLIEAFTTLSESEMEVWEEEEILEEEVE